VKSAGDQLKSFGTMKSLTCVAADQDASGRNYSFEVTFSKQKIRWVMGIDAQGKISSLYFHL